MAKDTILRNPQWSWEKLYVVKAGDECGDVAFYSPAHKRFLLMTQGDFIEKGSDSFECPALPGWMSWERFKLVAMPGNSKRFAIFSPSHKRFIRMPQSTAWSKLDKTQVVESGVLPTNWKREQWKVVITDAQPTFAGCGEVEIANTE